MKQMGLRIFTLLMAVVLSFGGSLTVLAEADVMPIAEEGEPTAETVSDVGIEDGSLELNCRSAILMEATTGAVLYRQNADEALPPASVTKIMTLLLVMEALDAGVVHLDSIVTVSANAASMGGSQDYLKEGEQMTLEDLLKSVVIASANDAAVALAEYIAGSTTAFVEKMNAKAHVLGMEETVFENVTGLDDTAEHHLTSAHDIALMSRALIAHETILQYSSIWMDTIRGGEFGLTNTNRLVRFYPGCTGLKTGSTSKAGFCVSVTAERNGMSLICVIMGAESRDLRNAIATELLDWGFSGYGLYRAEAGRLDPIAAVGGEDRLCELSHSGFSCVLPREQLSAVEVQSSLPEYVTAPIKVGDTVGEMIFSVAGREIGRIPIVSDSELARSTLFDVFKRALAGFLLI